MSDHVETTNPCLIFTATIPGEVPALARIVVDEDSAHDQRTVFVSGRVKNYDPDPPAAMYFEVDTLTPVAAGAAVITTSLPSGTSGSGCVLADTLSTAWQDVLKSTVAGSALTSVTGDASTDVFTKSSHGMVNGASVVLSGLTGGAGLSTSTTYYVINRASSTFQLALTPGGAAVDFTSTLSAATVTPTTYWTHTGRYRALVRVQPKSTNTGDVEVRANWGLGDLATYSQGPTRAVSRGGWTLADLGVINVPSTATRWEFRVQAKSTVAGDDVYVDVIYLPCADEASGTAQVTTTNALTTQTVSDTFNQSAGNLNGKTPSPQADGNWAESSAGKFTMDTSNHRAQRTGVSDTVGVNNGAFAVESSSLTGSYAQIGLYRSGLPGSTYTAGVVLRYSSTSSWIAAVVDEAGYLYLMKCVSGPSIYQLKSVHSLPLQYAFETTAYPAITVQAAAYTSGRFDANVYVYGNLQASLSVTDSDLATGGVLASGKVGFVDHYTSGTAYTRSYDDFVAGSIAANAACFASQSVEFSSTGWRREDAAGVVWGDPGNPQGDNFLLPPGTAEIFVKMSRAQIGEVGDDGVDDVSAKLYVTERGLLLPS